MRVGWIVHGVTGVEAISSNLVGKEWKGVGTSEVYLRAGDLEGEEGQSGLERA